jgi:hypothetical protein
LSVKSPKSVAIKVYWPELQVAEHEVIARMKSALANIGFDTVLVDQNGTRQDNREFLKPKDVLFCLDLHFQTPKIFGGVSVAALWNPPDYYEAFGLDASLEAQFSHDVYVAANPRNARVLLSMIKPEFMGQVLPLNHTVPSNFLNPSRAEELGVFYAGIGWDNKQTYPGRPNKLLAELEKRIRCEIYGPKKLADGSKPWRHYSSYKGDLPFDGVSLLAKAQSMGVVLAISSRSHNAAGIISNRVFEAIGAGCLPIVEKGIDSPFDLSEAIQIDPLADTETNIEALVQEIGRLNSNRPEFDSRVRRLQNRMGSGFTLEAQLRVIIDYCEGLFTSKNTSSQKIDAESLYAWLNIYLGVKEADLTNVAVQKVISSPGYSKFVREKLKESQADWFSFLDNAVIDSLAIEQPPKTAKAIKVGGVTLGNRGLDRALPLHSSLRPAELIPWFVHRDILQEWVDQDLTLSSIPLLFRLVALDQNRKSPTIEGYIPKSGFLRLDSKTILYCDSLINQFDRRLLFRGAEDPGISGRILALVEYGSKKYNQGSVGLPRNIDYLDVIRALAQIPFREIPRLMLASVKHIFKR